MSTLYVLAGPTASGKTELSLQFAQKNNCEIISCDASSFYRGMDIGTAKPTKNEQSCVKHWAVDIVNPNEPFSIKDYVTYIQEWVKDIVSRGKNILVVGGSGFYLNSFLAPVVDDVSASDEIISHVNDVELRDGLEGLRKELAKYNKTFPANFDFKNPRKVKKALMRCLATGKSLEALLNNFQSQNEPFPFLKKEIYGIVCPQEILKQRIVIRVEKMLQAGLLEEVKDLLSKNILIPGTPAGMAIGYRETISYLDNPTSLHFLSNQIIENTYMLAKKQTTWFRHQIKFDRYIFV